MRKVARMCTDNELSAQISGLVQIGMFAQDVVRLLDEDLLHLRMQMRLGLLNQDKMQRRDSDCVCWLPNLRLTDLHPLVPEAHESEDHGDRFW